MDSLIKRRRYSMFDYQGYEDAVAERNRKPLENPKIVKTIVANDLNESNKILQDNLDYLQVKGF
jgi:hypothetical protein